MADSVERAAGLLERAFGAGEMSATSTQSLVATDNAARRIGSSLGEPGDGDDLLLATLLIDDSLSIGQISGGEESVIAGHRSCLDVLDDHGGPVLVHTRFLSSGGMFPFRQVSRAPRLDAENYRLSGSGTPLFLQSVITLGTVMAKVREERERSVAARAFTVIITDGEDNATERSEARHVSALVRDMFDSPDDHIIAGMGIGSPDVFRPVFRDMGIPEEWILTSPANADAIRRLFRRIAKSLQLAASGDDGWLQLEAGPVSDED
jgi:hypothetical protein